MLKKLTARALHAAGYQLTRRKSALDAFPDISPEIKAIIAKCRPYTVTSYERLVSVCFAAEYVARHRIPGAFVECGVYKGGSSMAAAMTFVRLGETDRDFLLYDTFEGFPKPGVEDVSFRGEEALEMHALGNFGRGGIYRSPTAEVSENLQLSRYPQDRIRLIKGLVEETIPALAPDAISILRLDTDWYQSTKHELVHLFPRLSPGGVLIVDDYGHWAGARKAVDEYFDEENVRMLLHRVDYTGRIGVKS